MADEQRAAVGGGAKKLAYVLDTARRIGPGKAAKALTARNACKACALGMGGQAGGMTNEAGVFPSVCNKSVQAQSTDIQPPIAEADLRRPLSDLRATSARLLEKLGRLNTPIHKPAGADRYSPIGWDEALDRAAGRLAEINPDRSFFYASGRSSNEAGFLFQLIARLYGTNNVSNCSYYCHQATSVALGGAIGTGTATVELADLDRADLIFVVGANPASNHPRFMNALKACRDRGGAVIVINPAREPGLVKFASPKSARAMLVGGDAIASDYLQPRIGGDIWLFKGLAKAVIARGAADLDFADAHADGFTAFRADLDALDWPAIEAGCGIDRAAIEGVADAYARARCAVFAWGMGMTHHLHGVDNIEALINLALLRGMIGRPGAGLLPLRGHSNVQGIGTIGVKPVLAADVLDRIQSTLGVRLPEKAGLDTMAAMQAASAGAMDAAVILGGNLYAANPNSAWAETALDRIGFKLFLTTTLNKSHVTGVETGESIVLPVVARDEEWEPTTQESMFNYLRLSDGGIHRLDNARPESVALSALAQRLLPDAPLDFRAFARHRELRKAIAAVIPEMEDLADIDVARREFHLRNRLMHTPVFRTPNGRAQFQVIAPPAAPQLDGAPAPFMLTSVRSEGQFNGIIYQEQDAYRRVPHRWCVLMNAADLTELGLSAEGATATLRSTHGAIHGLTPVAFDLPRGAALMFYPEANALIGTAVDSRSKTPAFKSTPVAVTRTVDAATTAPGKASTARHAPAGPSG